jgi:K+-sensing histidine kinase KdpD
MAFLRSSREELLLHCTRTSEVLASSLDYRETLRNVTKWLTPILGHWLIIDLYDPVFDVVRRISVSHVDPGKKSIAYDFQRVPPTQSKDVRIGPRHIIASGQPEIDNKITPKKLREMGASEHQIELAQKLGAKSVLCVPLLARSKPLGVLTWVSSDPHRQHDKTDLEFAMEMGRIAAAHIDNSQLYWEVRRGLEMRDHILRIIAHDLRNPLSAIKLNADLLKRKKEQSRVSSPVVNRVSQSLHSASDRMNELIQDVTSFRDIPRTTETTLELVPTDFDDLVERSVRFLRPLCQKRKIEIKTELNTQTEFLLDEDKLQSAISLLVENTLFSVLPGSSIKVSTSQKGHTIVLDIYAKGELTEPLSSETGLITAREVFDKHGGRLNIERNEKHITFQMELPSDLKLSATKRAA